MLVGKSRMNDGPLMFAGSLWSWKSVRHSSQSREQNTEECSYGTLHVDIINMLINVRVSEKGAVNMSISHILKQTNKKLK